MLVFSTFFIFQTFPDSTTNQTRPDQTLDNVCLPLLSLLPPIHYLWAEFVCVCERVPLHVNVPHTHVVLYTLLYCAVVAWLFVLLIFAIVCVRARRRHCKTVRSPNPLVCVCVCACRCRRRRLRPPFARGLILSSLVREREKLVAPAHSQRKEVPSRPPPLLLNGESADGQPINQIAHFAISSSDQLQIWAALAKKSALYHTLQYIPTRKARKLSACVYVRVSKGKVPSTTDRITSNLSLFLLRSISTDTHAQQEKQ